MTLPNLPVGTSTLGEEQELLKELQEHLWIVATEVRNARSQCKGQCLTALLHKHRMALRPDSRLLDRLAFL